jgi:hypothetical protein
MNEHTTPQGEYRGHAITTRTSKKGNELVCYTRGDGRQFCVQKDDINSLKQIIDRHMQEQREAGLRRSMMALIKEHTPEVVLESALHLTQATGRQSIKSHDGKTYLVERDLLIKCKKDEVLDLAEHTSSFRDFSDFETALNKATGQFRKSPSARRKNLSAEVTFCLDALDGNWRHSREQESDGLGNRRYHWHGDKCRFLEHYTADPCSGVDYLESDFRSTFEQEVEDK